MISIKFLPYFHLSHRFIITVWFSCNLFNYLRFNSVARSQSSSPEGNRECSQNFLFDLGNLGIVLSFRYLCKVRQSSDILKRIVFIAFQHSYEDSHTHIHNEHNLMVQCWTPFVS